MRALPGPFAMGFLRAFADTDLEQASDEFQRTFGMSPLVPRDEVELAAQVSVHPVAPDTQAAPQGPQQPGLPSRRIGSETLYSRRQEWDRMRQPIGPRRPEPPPAPAPRGGIEGNFEDFARFMLPMEGGYTVDTGGRTRFGISEKAHPRVWKHGGPNLPEALEVAEREYWRPLQASAMPRDVALALADFAFNAGVPRAVKALQELVGAEPDGKVGSETLQRVWEAWRESEGDLAHDLVNQRAALHLRLVSENPKKYGGYAEGWERRNAALHGAIEELQRRILSQGVGTTPAGM